MRFRVPLLRVLVPSTGSLSTNICRQLDVLRTRCVRDGPKTSEEILDCKTIEKCK